MNTRKAFVATFDRMGDYGGSVVVFTSVLSIEFGRNYTLSLFGGYDPHR